MSTMKNLTGQTFGRLTVLGYAGNDQYGSAHWHVRCADGPFCVPGNEKAVRGSSLASGITKSCGCLSRETTKRTISADTLRREYVDLGRAAEHIGVDYGVAAQTVIRWLEADRITVRTRAKAVTAEEIAASRLRAVAARVKSFGRGKGA